MPAAPSVKVDFERFPERFVELPLPASSYSINGANNGVLIRSSNGTLSKFDLGTRENEQLLTMLLGPYSLNLARTKIAYEMGGTLGVLDLHPGVAIGQGKADTSGVETMVDPRDEWRQEFWEAWRHQRDHYYDPNMRGLDWEAIGKHYESYLPYVASRSDLSYVIGMMIGELGTGHSYVIGGDTGVNRTVPVGHLGVDYDVVGDHIRIA
jgi:tricorn protease